MALWSVPKKPRYTTSFPNGTENPISEAGYWQHLSPTTYESLVVTDVLSGVNVARGTMSGGQNDGGGNPINGTYNDSSCYLSGYFPPDQMAQGTIWKSASISGSFQECEILLRWIDGQPVRSTFWGNAAAVGYEINVNINDGSYLNIGQFSATSALATVNLATTIGRAPVTGDIFAASIQTSGNNAVITVYWNGSQVLQTTDTSPILTGAPGMGFYHNAGESNTQHGFSSFTAWAL